MSIRSQQGLASKRLVAAIAIALTALSTLLTPAWATKVYPAWVIPDSCIVRSGPGADRDKIGTLNKGAKVYVTAFKNKWCWSKLSNGKWGWIAEWLLHFDSKGDPPHRASASAPAKTELTSAWVSVDAANVRKSPGTSSPSYGTLKRGTKVYTLAKQGEWYKCRTPGGEGWIRRDMLELNAERGRKLAGASTPAASASATAKAYVNNSGVRLRKGPGLNYGVTDTLIEGQTLYITSEKGQWVKVTVHGGATGWINRSYVKYQQTPSIARRSVDEANELKGLAAWVGDGVVNVRYGASLDTNVKSQLSQGDKVYILDMQGLWLKIKYADDATGWIAGWCLDFSPPGSQVPMAQVNGEAKEARVGWVAADQINVRGGPGTTYEQIGDMAEGTEMVILAQQGSWYKVGMDSNKVGWVASWLVDTMPEREAKQSRPEEVAQANQAAKIALSHGGSETGQRIVELAMTKLGNPYVYGSAGPTTFDCSGLVYWVHRQLGIGVKRTTTDLATCGREVPRDHLEPGDVILFANTTHAGISHAAIYIGDGNFIHASTHRTGVKISSLNSSYYAPRFHCARRMY